MAGPWFQWHRAAAVYFGEQTVKAGSAVNAVKAVTGSLPLFLLVSSSSQDGSGTNKAEVRAVMEQWDHRCMCAFARIMPGRGDRNTMEDGLAGPCVGPGSQSSWKTLVRGSPCWRLSHQSGAICISERAVRLPHPKSSHGFHCHPTSKPKQWPLAESCGQ